MDDEPSEEDYKETIDIIKRNSDRLLGKLKNLSAISSDKDIELNEVVSLNKIFLNIIEESELSNIFKPFYRIDKIRSRNIEGNGLGCPL